MEGNIQQLIERYHLPGNRQVALKDIRMDHGTFEQVRERYENGIQELILIAVFRLKDKGEEIPALPGLMDGTMTVTAIVLRADTPDKVRWHIGAMINYSNETNSVTNRPNYQLPIGVVYAEGAVKGQLVDKNPDLAETFLRRLAALPTAAKMKEVKEMAKLWGEVYIPWINGSTGGKGKEKARESSPPRDAPPSPKPRHTIPGNPFTSANLPAKDADPETFNMTVEPEEDNNARSGSKSSKEESEATPKQKKQRPTRKLTNPVAIPITHIVEPDSLEAALTAFASQQGATTSVVIIDFPSPDDADKQRLSLAPRFQANLCGLRLLALNKILTQGGVLIERIDMAEFGAMKSDYQTAGAPTSATIHFAFQSAPISKGDLPNDSTLFGATNNVAHYAVTLRSPALLNWAKGSHWRRSWANLNIFGPCTVPDVDIVKYVTPSQSKKGEKKLPFFTRQVPSALWMELITLKHFLNINNMARDDAGKTLERLYT
ncbi:hypothetical protein M427DRAFT_32106 [Gonapodya prolifera JEL478]|uniref:Uncharacterized protein n=1 Tax=Gonapodya prolifera (strain JEL478) TaxID=1344416 RepID=A0A139AFZ2_GONPJ|nr:hypothetical protein M427DRAFT_32106 [Gonapodya prolifera JEL478]|eukprot:KXS15680.1 hypothetical protein M427DRAFT_32106 [Gonapodya prolifera JEL478]